MNLECTYEMGQAVSPFFHSFHPAGGTNSGCCFIISNLEMALRMFQGSVTVTDKKDPEKNIKAHSQALSALGNFFPPPNSHHCQYECSCTIVRDVGRHNI